MYACRAWVNFDGTASSPTPRASGNISSITKNGTGDYTINFATAMPDTNYTVAISFGDNSNGSNIELRKLYRGTTTSQRFSIVAISSDTTGIDVNEANLAIFR
jgi:hypothetical protein